MCSAPSAVRVERGEDCSYGSGESKLGDMYTFGGMGTFRKERGAAAVEFALILPVFLLLIFAIIEIGIAYQRWTTVTHAAREGVRRLAVGDAPDAATTAGELSAGNALGYEIECSLVPTADLPDAESVGMICEAPLELSVWALTAGTTIYSTAIARQE